jgi:hypothetical protein
MSDESPNNGEQSATNDGESLESQVEKWKALARKHEKGHNTVRSEVEALRAKAKELDDVKAAGLSSEERIAGLEAQLAALGTENETFKASERRAKVAKAAGLTAEDAAFVPFGTEEEMTASATALAKRLAASVKPVTLDGGARGASAKAPETLGDVIRGMKRR